MVRPRKLEAERRSRSIGVRVTTAEATEIAERAGAARMTKGGYIRRRALGSRSVMRPFTVSAPGSGSNSTGSAST